MSTARLSSGITFVPRDDFGSLRSRGQCDRIFICGEFVCIDYTFDMRLGWGSSPASAVALNYFHWMAAAILQRLSRDPYWFGKTYFGLIRQLLVTEGSKDRTANPAIRRRRRVEATF